MIKINKIIKKLRREIEKELLDLKEREEIIPPKTNKEKREIEIAFAEDILDTMFPESLRKFLLTKRRVFVINKQEILGLPTDKKTMSILEATKLLRIKRPGLLPHLIVISFKKDRALCLDILNGNKFDAPIVEVSFKKNVVPILFSKSFKRFIEKGEKAARQSQVKNLEISHKNKIRIIR